jgi:hypothetical protein
MVTRYDQLRSEWTPDRVRVLLVGESAPDPGPSERRFFYAPILDRRDNLFRGVVEAFYEPIPRGSTGQPKRPWLERLREDGVYLIDLVPFPVDKLPSAQRRLALRDHVSALVAQAQVLDPDGVIICHSPMFEAAAPALMSAGVRLLHAEPIPFPLGNHRAAFVAAVRAAIGR